MKRRTIRALVIDDSAFNRKTISSLLEEAEDVEVVGGAADGEEGLRLALQLKPDVITLDLEMPRMDGFTFLRILMAKLPTPVIVVSSYARKVNVFRALELGAVDFIAKPSRYLSEEYGDIRETLIDKIRTVRGLRLENINRRKVDPGAPLPLSLGDRGPMRVVAIGSSTGGPPALQHILAALPSRLNAGVLVAQHMPERFTQAFAERLDRVVDIKVRHASNEDLLERGTMLLAPGGHQMELVKDGEDMRVVVRKAKTGEVYVPSVDLLLSSVAKAAGERAIGVVLTGMGRDGRDGIVSIKDAGGVTVAESEETAVVFGMPGEAIETGKVDRVLPLDDIPRAIIDYTLASTPRAAPRRQWGKVDNPR